MVDRCDNLRSTMDSNIQKEFNYIDMNMELGEKVFKEELLELTNDPSSNIFVKRSKVKQERITAKEKTIVDKGDNIEEWKEKEVCEDRIKTINECLVKIKKLRESFRSSTTFNEVMDLYYKYNEIITTDYEKIVYPGMDKEAIEKMSNSDKSECLRKCLELDNMKLNNNSR